MLRAAADEKVPPDVRRRALASLGLLAIAPPGAISTAAASTEGAAAAKSLGWQGALAKVGAIVGIGGAVLGVGGAVVPPATQTPRVVEAAPTSRKPSLESQPVATVNAPSPVESNCPREEPSTAPSKKLRPELQEMGAGAPAADRRRVAPARSFTSSRNRPTSPNSSPAEVPHEEGRAAAGRAPEAPRPVAAASIREEIDLLDRARTQLSQGNSRAAREIIGQYFARYPSGELRAEAELVRREARLAGD